MFEWDARKADANRATHGVSFDEATTAFGDPHALDGPDLRHSDKESRFPRLDRAPPGRLLIVACTVRRQGNDQTIRIISSRQASRKERAAYAPSSAD